MINIQNYQLKRRNNLTMKNTIKFVGLHAHSTFSVFDGLGFPQEHIDFAISNGMNALALTDHGNMNGMSYQYLHSKKINSTEKKFKPIFGVEAYFIPSIKEWYELKTKIKSEKKSSIKDDDKISGTTIEDEEVSKKKKNPLNRRGHLLLLAQNQIGLSNIFKLISESFKVDNFYKMPRIDYEMLEKYSEGVIASNACIGGIYGMNYWENIEKGSGAVLSSMRETTIRMQKIFNNKWFGELQWSNIPVQHEINQFIIKLSKELNIPLISTADSHYSKPELWKDRILYKRIAPGFNKLYEGKELPNSIDEVGYELFPKNGNQMMDSYEKYSSLCGVKYDSDVILKSIENTYDVAFNLIEDFTPNVNVKLPSFVVPKDSNDNEYLSKKVFENFNNLNLDKSLRKTYEDRINTELSVISKRGFSRYFITMKAIADIANAIQLTGAGRGSGAGALISYVLGITQVDPIKWDLMFERFLRADATDWPDIDFDVSSNEEVKNKIIATWGEDNVVSISNWNTLQLKSLVKDISKTYGIPYKEVNDITSKMMFEAVPGIKEELGIKSGILPTQPTFEQVLQHSCSFKEYLEKYPKIKEHITNLFKQVRSCFSDRCFVLTDNGYKLPTEINVKQDKIAYVNYTNEISYNKDYSLIYNGEKALFLIELEEGYSIELTEDHKVFTSDGIKQVKDLTLEDEIIAV